jgi:nicotinamidase-related amidase
MVRRVQRTALLVLDVQKAFDDPAWGARNNPNCEANIATLLATLTADEVARVTASNLDPEFGRVTTTAELTPG